MIGKAISHYKILETICAGIIDVIYKIEETKLERHVALKLLPPVFATDSNAKERFMQENKLSLLVSTHIQ